MRRLLFPHLALWLLGAAVVRIAVVPAEICPSATPAQVRAAATAAGTWLTRGLSPDGSFVYGYDRRTDVESPYYTIVRHGGATAVLYQLAAGDPSILPAADAALGWMLDRVVTTGEGAAAIADPGTDARLGTTAFAIISLSRRRALTGDTRHDDLLRRLGRFVVGQREGNGALLAYWDPDTSQPVPRIHGPFATGEAVWSLAVLDSVFPGEGWAEAALPTLYYLASGQRERDEGYLARLPDHWAAYALGALDPALLDDELAAYARRLAGYFSLRLRFESQRTGKGVNLLVRWYPGPPAGVGTAGEAMGTLYALAERDARLSDLLPDMRKRLACMAGFMVERQVGPEEAAADPRPELTQGAWFYRDYTQVDGQQHVISALLGAAAAMEDGS